MVCGFIVSVARPSLSLPVARVQQFLNRSNTRLDAQEARALHIVVLILSLLGENFDFDELKCENVEAANQLMTITEV